MVASDGSNRRQSSTHLTCLASVRMVARTVSCFVHPDSETVEPNRMFYTVRLPLPLLIERDDGVVARTATASVGLIRTDLEREGICVHAGRNLHKVVRPVRTGTDAV